MVMCLEGQRRVREKCVGPGHMCVGEHIGAVPEVVEPPEAGLLPSAVAPPLRVLVV